MLDEKIAWFSRGATSLHRVDRKRLVRNRWQLAFMLLLGSAFLFMMLFAEAFHGETIFQVLSKSVAALAALAAHAKSKEADGRRAHAEQARRDQLSGAAYQPLGRGGRNRHGPCAARGGQPLSLAVGNALSPGTTASSL